MNRGASGFRWVGNKYAALAVEPPIQILPVASAYGTVLSIGDPVKVVSDGSIQAAAPGDAIYGVFVGAEQYYDGTVVRKGGSLPVSTWGTNLSRQSKARVIPARNQLFRVTCNDNTTATTQAGYEAFTQENAEWATGTATGDYSGATLNISTHANTNTLSVRIENIPDKELTNFNPAAVSGTPNVEVLVTFNLVQDDAPGSTTGTA